jgi:malonate transporter MadL subunit
LVIYGVAFLAGCMIAGLFLGEALGALIGVQANVGGVGIAMLLMILLSDRFRKAGRLTQLTEQGVLFWSSIYIPIVVAMAAKQNVTAAVKGGPAAILAGAGAVVVCFLLVPVLSRVGVGHAPAHGMERTDPAADGVSEHTAPTGEEGPQGEAGVSRRDPAP